MNYTKLASAKTCTGCMVCIDSCPHNALTPYKAKDGFVYVKCDQEKCVLCHKCERACPVVNGGRYASNTPTRSIPFSLLRTNDESYQMSTSGGAFISLAQKFTKEGGYVCGSVFSPEGHPCHIISNDPAELSMMQGSKYVQSDTMGIYREIGRLIGKSKKVLFFGMGCQAAAILSYFHNNKNRERLYVVDIICGGVPTSLLVDTFLKNEPRFIKIAGFRKKEKYVLLCYDHNGNIEYLSDKKVLPIYGFYSDLTKRYSCGNCKFCGIERKSDITIGDYWGAGGDKQKSVAVAHTDKGLDLLSELDNVVIEKISWSFIKDNFRYVIGKNYNNYRLQRKMLPWLFENLSYNSLCGIYGCNLKNPFWIIIVAYNHLVGKIQKLYINLALRKIMKHCC